MADHSASTMKRMAATTASYGLDRAVAAFPARDLASLFGAAFQRHGHVSIAVATVNTRNVAIKAGRGSGVWEGSGPVTAKDSYLRDLVLFKMRIFRVLQVHVLRQISLRVRSKLQISLQLTLRAQNAAQKWRALPSASMAPCARSIL